MKSLLVALLGLSMSLSALNITVENRTNYNLDVMMTGKGGCGAISTITNDLGALSLSANTTRTIGVETCDSYTLSVQPPHLKSSSITIQKPKHDVHLPRVIISKQSGIGKPLALTLE